MTTARTLVIAYLQVTLGHAHLARIRALSAIPGLRCIGIQYADRERTRGAEAPEDPLVRTLSSGTYEELPRPALVRSALRAVREVNADAAILDCPADLVQFATGRLLQRAGVATLVRWASTREDYPRRAWKELAKRPVYASWDGYLATGERALTYLSSFGVRRDAAFVCGNPVEHELFGAITAETAEQARSAFLFVGRFIWHKNLDRLLDAFSLYRARGGRFELRVAGDGTDRQAERIRGRLRAISGAAHLGFLPANALAAEYARAGCLVLPSISENWGLVVNEALHGRLPVIVSTRCGCVPELVREGHNGFLVDAESVESIADALRRMQMLGPVGRAAMGERGRELVAAQSLERWAEQTAEGVRYAIRRRGERARNRD